MGLGNMFLMIFGFQAIHLSMKMMGSMGMILNLAASYATILMPLSVTSVTCGFFLHAWSPIQAHPRLGILDHHTVLSFTVEVTLWLPRSTFPIWLCVCSVLGRFGLLQGPFSGCFSPGRLGRQESGGGGGIDIAIFRNFPQFSAIFFGSHGFSPSNSILVHPLSLVS